MPRVLDLEPEFGIYGERTVTEDPLNPTPYVQRYFQHVDTLAEAQGVWMLCPLCYQNKGGPIGVHYIDVTFADRGVPDHLGAHNLEGKPTRWAVSGTGYADLTTLPSIQLQGGACQWHGYITNGEAA